MALIRLLFAVGVLLALVYVVVEVPLGGRTVWSRVHGEATEAKATVERARESVHEAERAMKEAAEKPLEKLDRADRDALRRVLDDADRKADSDRK